MTPVVCAVADRPLTVALVGAGFVAPLHLRGWRRLRGVTVVALASRTRAKAERVARDHEVPRVYDAFEEMLDAERPDAVDICTPADAHLTQVRAAAARGIHVICQKPLADTMDEAREIARTAAEAGIRLMVHENFRFRVWYREMKRRLDAGVIGRPHYCHTDARMGGTVTTHAHPERPWSLARQAFFANRPRFLILESAIHQLDVCRYLFGEARSIYARARRVSPHVAGEDLVTMVVDFGDLHAVVERCYAARGRQDPPLVTEEVAVEGERGTLFLESDGRMRIEVDVPEERRTIRPEYPLANSYPESYATTIRHFVERLRDGSAFETDVEDNLRTLALTLAAYESLASDRVVPLDGDGR